MEPLDDDGSKPRVTPLGIRIDTILKEKGWKDPRLLAHAAGLKSETHVRSIMRRGSASIQILEAIARAGDVSFAWLAIGEGPRRLPKLAEGTVTIDQQPAPNLVAAISRRPEWTATVQIQLKVIRGVSGDVPLEWWLWRGDRLLDDEQLGALKVPAAGDYTRRGAALVHRIRTAMMLHAWGASQLGHETGIADERIEQIWTTGAADLADMIAIARATGVSLLWLAEGKGPFATAPTNNPHIRSEHTTAPVNKKHG